MDVKERYVLCWKRPLPAYSWGQVLADRSVLEVSGDMAVAMLTRIEAEFLAATYDGLIVEPDLQASVTL